jgi:hypothetical protein
MQVLLGAAVVCALLLAQPAYAYLDPGTGSYFLQILAASILGALFTLKLFWGRLKTLLKNLFQRKDEGGFPPSRE